MQLNGMPAEFQQDFRGQYTVGDNGTVSLPLLGAVRAAGLSTSQLATNIENKFKADKIFTNPTVQLLLPQTARTVTVGGAVRQPGAVPWSADLTLSSAIKRAGGIGDFGSYKKIKVTRDGQVAIFNLNNANKDPNQNPRLMPGDEVEIPE
jgi:polysaccharide export outer membrane protein